jgi:hypothetical protein
MSNDIPIPQGVQLAGKPCFGVVRDFNFAVAAHQAKSCAAPGVTLAAMEPAGIPAFILDPRSTDLGRPV